MNFIKTNIEGLIIIEPKVFFDSRGWFVESYNQKKFDDIGIIIEFIQDNHSFSLQKGVFRGLHFQNEPYAQTKLVRCTKGKVWDVVVDLRKSSSTYLKWYGVELSYKNHRQLLIPRGFAHGFLTLEENSEVQYKVDNFYHSNSDRSIRYDDPDIGIIWPIEVMILSDKDIKAPYLKDSDVNFK
jgi:dTDP-4-dehydrorhamnose reductase/dTDP-4-dehydrorhamnose 3,5-epimerase